MPLPLHIQADADADTHGRAADAEFRAMLAPIMAGARARGVADGLELLGVGAVLIDATGCVLHAGERGRRMMAGWLRVVERHLVAERPGDDHGIAELLGSAIAGRPTPGGLRLGGLGGEPSLTVRALVFPSDEGSAQRLHAVLVLDET